ncbi:MAG: DUF4956 domain-containing protein [Clostridia bacterium]|nr:DUF4956 domain-containing protein [Clostridia bacterium]
MKTLINEFKTAIQESGLLLELDAKQIMIGVGIALMCSIVIYLVYRIFYRGTCYSENFNLLLVMTSLITTFIIMTISANIVLSLGMVGSLSIIRFRSAVKDPLDVGFLFWSVAVGITCGAGLYKTAIYCTLFIAAVYVAGVLLRFGIKRYLLVVKYDNSAQDAVKNAMPRPFYKLKNSIRTKTDSEITIQVSGKGFSQKLQDKLLSIDGVSNVMLVEFTSDM